LDTKNKPQVIGITGPFGSGKSTAATFFEKKGFSKVILSSFLEESLIKENKKITRKNLQDLGNAWRTEEGPEVLAKKAVKFAVSKNLQKLVIDGIRNVGEIEFLKKKSDFALIGIVADRDVRFERVKNLKNRESLTRELFDQLDNRDFGMDSDSVSGLQVAKCLAVSNYFVDSNHGYERLEKDLEELVLKINK
jgi:dephospho-CoA kinase